MNDKQRLLLDGHVYTTDAPALQAALERVHGSQDRPLCMCVEGGIPMYVARHGALVAKRMPGTGCKHHPSCPSYEPDYTLSGLGALMGQAVLQHGDDQVELRVDFPLTRGQSRPRRPPADNEAPAVKSSPPAMSLRALLHYLYEQAGINRWYPAMEGRRHHRTVRKYLSESAANIIVKGMPLSQRLFIPEAFQLDQQEQIAQRRSQQLAFLNRGAGSDAPAANLALVLGEFKGEQPATGARRIWLKHMPDQPLMIRNEAWQKVTRRFGTLLTTREADVAQTMRLLLFALVQAENERLLYIDSALMMLTTANWIPLEGPHEVPLLAALTAQRRKFVKPLRYDAPTAGHFPNVLLLDTGAQPTPLHIVSAFASPKENSAKQRALSESPQAWVWHTDASLPALPPPA
ncbi:DUF1173 family protein [Rugamonas aquatica]|uniref:DUF1173 family protein n=1 Tax=Rugamonas aquatica TaxID=2743357 RepID=A0A6A7N6C4_9BURK|nr:DUF1173 family protein [Rugamonas aquatica]MQA40643.1 DUF1173 family protein [Rugamonas aquatica]